VFIFWHKYFFINKNKVQKYNFLAQNHNFKAQKIFFQKKIGTFAKKFVYL